MSQVHLKVIVDDAHLGDTDAICRAVQAAGMRVESVIAEAGTIFGSAEETTVTLISRVEGVLRAAPEAAFEAPPMTGDAPK